MNAFLMRAGGRAPQVKVHGHERATSWCITDRSELAPRGGGKGGLSKPVTAILCDGAKP